MRKILAGAGASIAALLLAVTGSTIVFAGGGTAPQSANVKLQAVIVPTVSITLDHDTAAAPIDFGNVTPLGSPYNQTLNATVQSNGGWSLKVFKVNPGGACTGDMANAACTNILPATALQWKVGAGAYAQVTGTSLATSQVVATSAAPTASTAVAVVYQLAITWLDPADSYSAIHTYTVTQP